MSLDCIHYWHHFLNVIEWTNVSWHIRCLVFEWMKPTILISAFSENISTSEQSKNNLFKTWYPIEWNKNMLFDCQQLQYENVNKTTNETIWQSEIDFNFLKLSTEWNKGKTIHQRSVCCCNLSIRYESYNYTHFCVTVSSNKSSLYAHTLHYLSKNAG